jgi:hypothetical protein
MSNEVHIDHDRAKEIFDRLTNRLTADQFPYSEMQLPQTLVPKEAKESPVSWANFLWCVCYWMRGGIQSEMAFARMASFYLDKPNLFDFKYLAEHKRPDKLRSRISGCLEKHRLTLQKKVIPHYWLYNASKIANFWGGSPLGLFEDDPNFDTLCERIIQNKANSQSPNGFYSFKHKMVSMIAYFLADAGLIDEFLFPVPVDFHVLRMLLAHEIIVVEGLGNSKDGLYVERVRSAAREVTHWYCCSTGKSSLRLADSLWFFSNTLCNKNPGNSTRIVGPRKGRSTLLVSDPISWTDAQTSSWSKSCGSCPVHATCRWNIPAGTYYVNGKLVIRGERKANTPWFAEQLNPNNGTGH